MTEVTIPTKVVWQVLIAYCEKRLFHNNRISRRLEPPEDSMSINIMMWSVE